MNQKRLLRWFMIIGGVFEIIIGFFLMILHPFLWTVGMTTIPIFNQMAGTFLLGFGILLVFSSTAIEPFRIIPLVNILLRIIMIIFSFIQLPQYPNFLIILLPAMIYDLLWSILVLILLKNLGLLKLQIS